MDFSDALHKSKKKPRHLHIQYHGASSKEYPMNDGAKLGFLLSCWSAKMTAGLGRLSVPSKNRLRFWSTRFVYKVARCCKCVLLVERVGVLFTPIAFLPGWWTCFPEWGKTQSLLSREHLDVISSVWKYRIMSIPDYNLRITFWNWIYHLS